MTKQEIEQQIKDIKLFKIKKFSENKYEFYTPNAKVEEFINLFGSCEKFVCLLSAANGIGKTTILVNILAHLFFPCGNPYFQQKLFTDFPYPVKSIRIASDPTTIKDTIIPAIEEWFPKGRYTATKNNKPYNSHYVTDTVWDMDLMSYEQDAKEFESANKSIIVFDEPPKHDIYIASVARTRSGGQIGILATPLSGSAWMYDEIVANSPEDNEKNGRAFVTADVECACIEHGIRGHLKHENIERMIAQYPEDEKFARIFGKFKHLTGLVFKRWDRDIHIIKPFDINFNDYAVFHSLDPHTRTPDAGIWLAVDRKGQKFIINEMFESVGNVEQLGFRLKEIDKGKRILRRLIDPSALIRDQHSLSELSTGESLQRMGLNYELGSKERHMAIRKQIEALYYEEEKGLIKVAPKTYIFESCPRLIYEIEHYQWDDWKGKTRDDKSQMEKPKDKDDHLLEAWGRIEMINPQFVEYIPINYNENNNKTLQSDPYE